MPKRLPRAFVMPDHWDLPHGKRYRSFRNAHTDFTPYFEQVAYFPQTRISKMREGDVLFLEGGTDIQAKYYGESPGISNWAADPQRDQNEFMALRRAMQLNNAVFGVCRGAQLAVAALGGKLIQDVSGHQGAHSIELTDGRKMKASSVHHQMMFPWACPTSEKWEILAWTDSQYVMHPNRRYVDGDGHRIVFPTDFKEPEVLWFPERKVLGIQGHPEYVDWRTDFAQYCYELFETLILGERTNVNTYEKQEKA